MSTMTFNCPYLNINNVPIKVNHLHVGNETSSTAIKRDFLMIFLSLFLCNEDILGKLFVKLRRKQWGWNPAAENLYELLKLVTVPLSLYIPPHGPNVSPKRTRLQAVGSCDFEETWLFNWTTAIGLKRFVCVYVLPCEQHPLKRNTQVLKSCRHFSRFKCWSNWVLPWVTDEARLSPNGSPAYAWDRAHQELCGAMEVGVKG